MNQYARHRREAGIIAKAAARGAAVSITAQRPRGGWIDFLSFAEMWLSIFLTPDLRIRHR